MTEATLIRLKAEQMSRDQVVAELQRIGHGLAAALFPRERKRWESRQAIFQERLRELDERDQP